MSPAPDSSSRTPIRDGVFGALSGFLASTAQKLAGSVRAGASAARKPASEDLSMAAASLIKALDHGHGVSGIACALGQFCAAPSGIRTANELKKLETHLINRVHENSLPLMCNWRGRPKPHFEAIHRAVVDNYRFAQTYALPTAQDKYPYVDQKALVSALGMIGGKLTSLN